jgi:hypothetical protein
VGIIGDIQHTGIDLETDMHQPTNSAQKLRINTAKNLQLELGGM